MTEILIIGFIIIIFISLGVYEKNLTVIKSLLNHHATIETENLKWVRSGCFVIDNNSSSTFWDGFFKLAVSDSGVHFKSLFVGSFCIPWENLNYGKKSMFRSLWFPWLRTELSSSLVGDGSLLTSNKIFKEIELNRAANQQRNSDFGADAPPPVR